MKHAEKAVHRLYPVGRSLFAILILLFCSLQAFAQGLVVKGVVKDATGEPVIGAPGSSQLGNITAGALEESNVDLSEQLVNLIIAQRNYQANAKTIETANAITQTVINLR